MSRLDPNRLWAKGLRRKEDSITESMTLLGHLKDALAAADRVLEATADAQLAALGLDDGAHRDRFVRCVRLAAASHDLGKANDHFQGMLLGERNVQQNPQGLRHEWVSVLLLEQLKPWLLPAVNGSELDFALVQWAVGGHHPARDHASPPRECPPGAGREMKPLVDGKDFASVLDWLQTAFAIDLGAVPTLVVSAIPLVGQGNAFARTAEWAKSARRTWELIRRSKDRLLLAAMKNCLVAADIAGSALPLARPDAALRWRWIDESFATLPKPGDYAEVAKMKLNGATPREFQNDVAASASPITYVKAGCGSGKTIAAYLWAANNHPDRRLYFCYPTTGTATEGFRGYLFDDDAKLSRINADLFHGRADIDFEVVLEAGRDRMDEEQLRLDSLRAWKTPVVACTVDTVLGIVQNHKRGMFAWPTLAQAAFVFDEIHAFDDQLFGALLRFLRDLPGLPALLMTASLPTAREEALRELCREHRGFELAPIGGPTELEELERYCQAEPPNRDPWPLVEEEWAANRKTLWVCNTVGRAMEVADEAERRGIKPLIYHSRFKYGDRVQRHKEVVAAFSKEHVGPALAICTQVAEMSLDLQGCTLLVTDLAPVPALIQRLGRLNRQAMKGSPIRPFVVIEPSSHLPYTPVDFDCARTWLGKLPTEKISQKMLSDAWEQTGDQPPDLVASTWLDGGPYTLVGELREASPGLTVVLEQDAENIRSAKDLTAHALPMPPPPKQLDWKGWRRCRGLPVAPEGTVFYNETRGAEWRK